MRISLLARAVTPFVVVLSLSAALGCASQAPVTGNPQPPSDGDGPVAVQPGAPGEATRVLTQDEMDAVGLPGYTEADVEFMQGMIAHHAQALDMTALVPGRSNNRNLALLAKRIDVSQTSEIQLMQDWLRRRGEIVPEASADAMMMNHGGDDDGNMDHDNVDHADHADHAAMNHDDATSHLMPGMLTPEQMAELEAASGVEFYRLFLEYMIQHHAGALFMVDELFNHDGAAQDTEVFRFASDVDVDQRMEITRMQQMLDAAGTPGR